MLQKGGDFTWRSQMMLKGGRDNRIGTVLEYHGDFRGRCGGGGGS